MCFLPGVELGLLAAEPTLGLRYLHPFSGAQPDQVGLELRDHGQHVEQQPADRVVRVVDRGAETETDLPGGEFVGKNTVSVKQVANTAERDINMFRYWFYQPK